MTATAPATKPKASTYTVKMELRDGKPIYSIPKKHRDAFVDARDRAMQYALLGMNGLSDESRAVADAITKLLEKLS